MAENALADAMSMAAGNPAGGTAGGGNSSGSSGSNAGGGSSAAGGGGRRSGRQPPWDKGGEADPASFGIWLRRQREMREITLREVADRTKISLRYLEAMEEDRFDLLPAPVFAKGFLREYARYVGLSPDEVVNHWLAAQQSGDGPEERPPAGGMGGSGRGSRRLPIALPALPPLPLFLAVLVLLLVLSLVFGGVYWLRHRAPSATGPAALSGVPANLGIPPAPTPLPAAPPAAEPAAEAPLEVTLDFSRQCWVDILIDGDSKKRVAQQQAAGETLRLVAQKKVQLLTLGDAGAAEVRVNGAPFVLPVTARGKVLHDVVIDLETLKPRKEKKEAR